MNEFILNDEQIAQLHFVKRVRIRTVLFPMVVGSIFLVFSTIPWWKINGISLFGNTNDDTPEFVFWMNVLLYGGFIFILWIITELRIGKIRKDIKLRSGIRLPLKIIRKTFYPYSHDFFLFFDHPKFPHVRISRQSYLHFNEGDFYYLALGKHSKIELSVMSRVELF